MKILAIKSVTTKAGRPMILVSTAKQDLWLTVAQWNAKGASATLDNYVGGEIDVDFYAKGEKLTNGAECTADDTLLRDFQVSANATVLAASLAIESRLKMEAMLDKSALFARNKAKTVVATEEKIETPNLVA